MQKQTTLVFDLDDTICFPNHDSIYTYEKYFLAKPNTPVIEKLRELDKLGYKIVISTARRMVTHNGCLTKIIEDVGELTKKWLSDHGVPYSEIIFGKPYGAYYVDDKAMTIEDFLSKESKDF